MLDSGHIKFTIALNKATNKLVNVKEVTHGKECNCYCDFCKEDLIAVNKEVKQVAHFRHNKDSNCSILYNFETYIHWLAKKIIEQNIDTIKLPPIYLYNIENSLKGRLKKISDSIEKNNPINELHENQSYLNHCLQPATDIKFKECHLEKTYNTNRGDIRVDVVLKLENIELFIEPFYHNRIDNEKLKRISILNVSTISIDLHSFVKMHNNNFTIQQFSEYIKNDIKDKDWIYIRESRANALTNNLFNATFEAKLRKLKVSADKNKDIYNRLDDYQNKKIQLHKDYIRNLKRIDIEINALTKQIEKIRISDLFEK